MSCRLLGVIFLTAAILAVFAAARMGSPLPGAPLAPGSFPLVVSLLIAGLSLIILQRPDLCPLSPRENWAGIYLLLALLMYRFLLPWFGALLAMTICLYFVCHRLGGRWAQGLLLSLSLTLVLLGVVRFVFDGPLSMGPQ